MIHVVSAVIATGAFTLGGMLSVLYLAQGALDGEHRLPRPRCPSSRSLDRLSYRMHAFGFPVWTFAVLITGPIWAHQAWSSYWNWDPKEVWAFITWVVYAAYLHARATAGWRGRNAAILALVGVATLWFNFIGINFFSSTQPALLRRGSRAGEVSRPRACGAGRGCAGSRGRRRVRSPAGVTLPPPSRRRSVSLTRTHTTTAISGDDEQDLQHSSNVVATT